MAKLKVFSGKQFTWTGRTGSGEASDLGIGMVAPRKIVIESHRTGSIRLFDLDEVKYTSEDEIMSWNYLSADGISVRIWND